MGHYDIILYVVKTWKNRSDLVMVACSLLDVGVVQQQHSNFLMYLIAYSSSSTRSTHAALRITTKALK